MKKKPAESPPALVKTAGSRRKPPGGRRFLGVDPGLASVGWGVIDMDAGRLRHVAHGCIETEAGQPRAERLLQIYTRIGEAAALYRPAESAIEALYFARNVSSAMSVAEARGVIVLALCQAGVPPREFTPNEIKKAVTGLSRADKTQVQEMIRILLGLAEIPRPDHAADALAAAICAANTPLLADPALRQPPESRRRPGKKRNDPP